MTSRSTAETTSWPMVGDPQSLERAVTNLLDNAARSGAHPEARSSCSCLRGLLTVDDEGPGIDPPDRPHVFDRFYRAEGARGTPGSGLGLAIVAQAVTQHGGTVAVGDSPSGGARFEVASAAERVPPELSGPAQALLRRLSGKHRTMVTMSDTHPTQPLPHDASPAPTASGAATHTVPPPPYDPFPPPPPQDRERPQRRAGMGMVLATGLLAGALGAGLGAGAVIATE